MTKETESAKVVGIPRADGITAFLVDAKLCGISIGPADKKMGQRGALTADVVFDNVYVPATAIIGGPEFEGRGFKTAMKVLDRPDSYSRAVRWRRPPADRSVARLFRGAETIRASDWRIAAAAGDAR